ncbi:MAG: hypothetical protein K2G96_01500 [Clostridia bacterium]|nr:hypothetical protein [Clostridia bacterium]
MKTQMRFQKILMLVSLIIGALSIVYALIFCSGTFNQLAQLRDYDDAERYPTNPATGVKEVFNASQSFSDLFLILGIVLILVAVLLYIAACQKRRKYYVTNYVAIGIAAVYQIVYAILLFVLLANIQTAYDAVNFENCEYWYEYANFANAFGKLSTNTWSVSLGYALAALVLVNTALLIGNLVWKILLMQGEKKLLENGLVKEVA